MIVLVVLSVHSRHTSIKGHAQLAVGQLDDLFGQLGDAVDVLASSFSTDFGTNFCVFDPLAPNQSDVVRKYNTTLSNLNRLVGWLAGKVTTYGVCARDCLLSAFERGEWQKETLVSMRKSVTNFNDLINKGQLTVAFSITALTERNRLNRI